MRTRWSWIRAGLVAWWVAGGSLGTGRAEEVPMVPLTYQPAPVDNPLKGFVPYLRKETAFPHSMEWDYTRLADVMTGYDVFDWRAFDAKLEAAASRGHQFIARFYLEWPGRPTAVPRFLIDAGLTMRRWTNTNTQPHPPAIDHTPDYEDPRLRRALTNFIHALGRRYDGDPRLGFLGLGLLGTWGEWHNHPNNAWFASKTVQQEVLDAFETAFRWTRLVARYPAGSRDPRYADNAGRAIGYHDDSFAWATVHTGKRGEEWFFESRLRAADALGKWRTQPIGGEVRPEVWACLFDEPSCAPKGQEWERCVEAIHVSWLCNEGVFSGKLAGAARERALGAVRRMGYELHVAAAGVRWRAVDRAGLRSGPATTTSRGSHPRNAGTADETGDLATRRSQAPNSDGVAAADGRDAGAGVPSTDGRLEVALSVTNTGVAPFYYPWPVELSVIDARGAVVTRWMTDWKLPEILPGDPATRWQSSAGAEGFVPGTYRLLMQVPNPLPRGHPVRFANRDQDRDRAGWLTLGAFTVP